MQNRQKDEMVRDILTATNGGATITQIMFRSYTTHSQAKSYLDMLIRSGMIEHDVSLRRYRSTDRGLRYLAGVNSLSEILSISTKRYTKIIPTTIV